MIVMSPRRLSKLHPWSSHMWFNHTSPIVFSTAWVCSCTCCWWRRRRRHGRGGWVYDTHVMSGHRYYCEENGLSYLQPISNLALHYDAARNLHQRCVMMWKTGKKNLLMRESVIITFIVITALSRYLLPYRAKVYTWFNLATWLILVKFMI